MVLSQEKLEEIIRMAPEENDHWDFKLQWYKKNNRNDLLLDIMNMVNTPHHDDCYIIIGVDDKYGDIVGIKDNKGRMNRQNLQDFLRKEPFAQNFYPLTDVKRYEVYSPTEGKNVKVDVITIFNENNVPIYLNEDVEDKPKYIYQMNPDFVVEETKDEQEEHRDHFVAWAQTLINVRVDYKYIQLKYRGIVIKEYLATKMAGERFIACNPEIENIGNDNFFYYYAKDSLRYFVNEMINNVRFPDKTTHSWEGYDQIKKNLVMFKNITELNNLKSDKSLQHELNQDYEPNTKDISGLARKICNNREKKKEVWTDSETIAKQFLVEKHNAMMVKKYLEDNNEVY